MKDNNFSYIVGPASNFRALGISHIGNAHVVSSMACQDAYKLGSGTFSEKPWAVFSVADGHGAEEFEYSDVGSANACQAIEMAFELMLMEASGDVEIIKEKFLGAFAEQVQRLWEVLCKYHYKFVLPLVNSSFEEQLVEDEKVKREFGSKELSKYGSTLSSVLLYDDHIFIYRIGDSDVVLLQAENSASHVFISDENIVNSETYSLCSANATEVSQLEVLDIADCKAIFLATDGLINSYKKEESLFKLIRNIDAQFRNNSLEDLDEQISATTNYIKNLSIKGSGDDITLVHIAFFKTATNPKPKIEENAPTDNAKAVISHDENFSVGMVSTNNSDTGSEHLQSEQAKKKVNP